MQEITFKPYQPVLVREGSNHAWLATYFSHVQHSEDGAEYVCSDGKAWAFCLPYNDETAHLVGTYNSPVPPKDLFRYGDCVEVSNDNSSWRKAIYYKFYTETVHTHVVLIEEIGLLGFKYCRHANW